MADTGTLLVLLCGPTADGVREALDAAGFRVTVTDDYAESLREPADRGPRLVVFDAQHATVDVISSVARVSACPNALALVVSTDRDPEQIVATIRAGAVDYIVKDADGRYLSTLPERIRRLPVAAAGYSATDMARHFHQMSRNLSHDIRNPVGNVMGFLELLRDTQGTKFTEEQVQFLDRIKANCSVILDLLKQFTAATRKFSDPD